MSSRRGKHKGFALLITITLLAFLVLLLVSLASLTRVETQVANNSQQLGQARQNALMALNIAIGQLQKTVGPDQRTTARADMADPNNVNGFTTLPKAGATRWTSAWGNANAGDYTLKPSQVEAQADPATGSVNKPRLLSWLVSGNEGDTFSANSNGAITTASNTSKFNPGLTVTGLSATATALTPLTLPVANPVAGTNTTGAVLLVGPNSVSSTNETYTVTTTNGSTYTGSDYVAAPLVDIQGTVPGQATATTIGRYAYWVGDENIKARDNLVDNYLQQPKNNSSPFYSWLVSNATSSTTLGNDQAGIQQATGTFSAFVAQHSGISFMDATGKDHPALDASGGPSGDASARLIETDYNYNNYDFAAANINSSGTDTNLGSSHVFTSEFTQLLASNQLPFVGNSNPAKSNANPTTSAILSNVVQNRFHDISSASASVIADSYAGGLKKDMSAAFAAGWSPSSSHETYDSKPLFTVENSGAGNDIDPSSGSTTWSAVPTWGHLRSYFSIRTQAGQSPPNGNITIKQPTRTSSGIYPTITYASLGFSVFQSGGQLYLAFYPFIGLCNPYQGNLVPASPATSDQIGFSFRGTGTIALTVDIADATTGVITRSIPISLTSLMEAGKYLTFPITTGTINSGSMNRYVLQATQSGTNYVSGGNAMVSDGSSNGQTYYVQWPVPGGALNATEQNEYYQLRYTGISRAELDVVYANKAATLSGYTPPVPQDTLISTPCWWHMLQHVGFLAPIAPTNPAITALTPGQSGVLLAGGNGANLPNVTTGQAPTMPNFCIRAQALLSPANNRTAFLPPSIGALDTNSYNDPSNGTTFLYSLRWWAQANGLRAPVSSRTKLDTWANGAVLNSGTVTFGGVPATRNTNQSGQNSGVGPTNQGTFFINLENVSGFGYYHRQGANGKGRFFDVPRDDIPLLSLGQLQNANLSLSDAYPMWAFGNSLADYRIPGNKTYLNATTTPAGGIEKPGANVGQLTGGAADNFGDTFYDLSWHLNRALWDKFFVSSVPAGGYAATNPSPAWTSADLNATTPLPNARMTYVLNNGNLPSLGNIAYTGNAANPSYDQASANLMVAGGFNVNSTSDQAWRAVLGGTSVEPYNFLYPGAKSERITPIQNVQFPRGVSYWSGYSKAINDGFSPYGTRWLTNSALNAVPYVLGQLATDIVNQVKIRGPFLSLGDFVNRRLLDVSGGNALAGGALSKATQTGLKGTIQAALDADTKKTGNIPASSRYPSLYPALTGIPLAANPGITGYLSSSPGNKVPANSPYFLNQMRGNDGTQGNQSYCSTLESGNCLNITQADILSAIGPALAARSDTFTIRTYGEVVNPATGVTEGRAWCEAVLQRFPAYVDQTDAALAASGNATPPSSTNPTNQKFGRRFQLISFKWLTPNDI